MLGFQLYLTPNLFGRLKGFTVVFLPLLIKIANIFILKIGVNALFGLLAQHRYSASIDIEKLI